MEALDRDDGPLQRLREAGGQPGGVEILRRGAQRETGNRVRLGAVEPPGVVEKGTVAPLADLGDDLLRPAHGLGVQHGLTAADEAVDGTAARAWAGFCDIGSAHGTTPPPSRGPIPSLRRAPGRWEEARLP